MKKLVAAILLTILLFCFASCTGVFRRAQTGPAKDGEEKERETYVDLTALNPLLAYAQLSNMIGNPERYIGAEVKVRGRYASYFVSSLEEYHASIVVEDTPNCCSVGLEFVLQGDLKCPEDYPARDEILVLNGFFDTYEDEGSTYYRLINATIVG